MILLRSELRKYERKWLSSNLIIDSELFTEKRLAYFRGADELKQSFHREGIVNSDSKHLFSIVDHLTGNKNANNNVTPTNISSHLICDEFAKYFHEKVIKLRDGLEPCFEDVLLNKTKLYNL